MAAAIVAAVTTVLLRRRRRARLRAAARARPGASMANPIAVRSYGEIDEHVGRRWCTCGGFLERRGETTRESGGRRFRVVKLACQECEEPTEVVFDTTDVLH